MNVIQHSLLLLSDTGNLLSKFLLHSLDAAFIFSPVGERKENHHLSTQVSIKHQVCRPKWMFLGNALASLCVELQRIVKLNILCFLTVFSHSNTPQTQKQLYLNVYVHSQCMHGKEFITSFLNLCIHALVCVWVSLSLSAFLQSLLIKHEFV